MHCGAGREGGGGRRRGPGRAPLAGGGSAEAEAPAGPRKLGRTAPWAAVGGGALFTAVAAPHPGPRPPAARAEACGSERGRAPQGVPIRGGLEPHPRPGRAPLHPDGGRVLRGICLEPLRRPGPSRGPPWKSPPSRRHALPRAADHACALGACIAAETARRGDGLHPGPRARGMP